VLILYGAIFTLAKLAEIAKKFYEKSALNPYIKANYRVTEVYAAIYIRMTSYRHPVTDTKIVHRNRL